MFFKATVGLGLWGMQYDQYFEADSAKESEELARELAIDLAEQYGFEQNEEVFGDLYTIGRDFNEDSEEYEEVGTLGYYVEAVSEEEFEEGFEENNQ